MALVNPMTLPEPRLAQKYESRQNTEMRLEVELTPLRIPVHALQSLIASYESVVR